MKKTMLLAFAIIAVATSIVMAAYIMQPYCNKPYIQVGRDCCLDENNDRICDKDKPITTTTLSTTTTTTTTTTITIQVVETTVTTNPPTTITTTTSPTTTIEKTTTTTLSTYDFDTILSNVGKQYETTSTTSTTIIKCVDSDGGRDYEEFSRHVSGYYIYNGTNLTDVKEECDGDKELLEYYCMSGVLKSRKYKCPEKCIEGRCCRGDSTKCSGDKDCCSGKCRAVGMEKVCI